MTRYIFSRFFLWFPGTFRKTANPTFPRGFSKPPCINYSAWKIEKALFWVLLRWNYVAKFELFPSGKFFGFRARNRWKARAIFDPPTWMSRGFATPQFSEQLITSRCVVGGGEVDRYWFFALVSPFLFVKFWLKTNVIDAFFFCLNIIKIRNFVNFCS